MKIFTLLALLIALVAVVFSLQNSSPVLVYFLSWQVQESMGLILLLTFTLGVTFGFLLSIPPMIGRMRKISRLKRKVDEQAYDLETINHQLIETNTQLKVFKNPLSVPHTDIYALDDPSETSGR